MKKNLMKRMLDEDLKNTDIAECIQVNRRTIDNKIKSVTEFTISEAFMIRDKFFPNDSIDYLFTDSAHENNLLKEA